MNMRRARGLSGLVVIAAAIVASPAFAQGGGGGGGGGGRGGGGGGGPGGFFRGMGGGGQQQFDAAINSRELDNYAKVLGLDAAQKDAAKSLFEAYEQQFTAAAKVARAKLDAARQEARDTQDFSVMRDVQKDMDAFNKTRTDLENSFFSDFKAVLNDQQMQKWPKLERARRRSQSIGRGLMSGERVDVAKIVDDMKLPPETQQTLAPILEQYEVEIDRQLIERNKVYDDFQGKIRELFQSGDQTAIDELFKKGREVSVRVRDTNRTFARQIEAQLPEDKRGAFSDLVHKESFPTVYRPVYADRVVDAAIAIADLEAPQKEALTSLKESYTRDVRAINHDLEVATEDQEMTLTAQSMMQRMGGGGDDKVSELRRKKRELGTSAIERINSVLTEAQRAKLPTRDQTDNADGGGRRGGGAAGDNAAPRARRNRPADQAPPPPDRNK
jgi:hypothetical protein